MEQSVRSDSTRMSAAQVETRDLAQEARVAAMLTAPADPARPLVAKIFRALEEAERVWAPVAALYNAADAEATAAGITTGRAEEAGLPTWRAYSAAWKQAQPGMEEFCASVAPLMKRPARTLDDLMLKHRISLTLQEYEGEAVADLDRLAKSWSPAPRVPTPPFSAAAEVSLAYMVVDYFGSEDIHPALNCDIALRDRARAIVAAAAEPDPINAAIKKDRALAGEHIRLLSISGSKPDDDPSWEPTHDASDAQWAHWREVLLKTVPTTAAGCSALARYANEWVEREGVGLDEDGAKIFALIGRSPLITAPLDTEALGLIDSIERTWAEWSAEQDRDLNDFSPEAEKRHEARNAKRDALINAAVALPATTRSARHAKALALAWIELVDAQRPGQPREKYSRDGKLWFDIDAALVEAAGSTREDHCHDIVAAPQVAAVEGPPSFDLSGLSMLELLNLMEEFEASAHHWIGVENAPWARMRAGRRTLAGEIADAEFSRQSRIRDAIAAEVERRANIEGEDRDIQLEALVRYELMCNGSLREAPALLAAITRQWGA